MSLNQVLWGVLLGFLIVYCKAEFSEWKQLIQYQDPVRAQELPQPVWGAVQDSLLLDIWRPVQEKIYLQSKQRVQGPIQKLAWHFPLVPETPRHKIDENFQLRRPVRANSVAADCGENVVHVEVKKDLFGTGELLNPLLFSLGGCTATGEDSETEVLIFEYDLQSCNSSLTMTEDELVYTYTLIYAPEPIGGTPVVRTGGVAVGIDCHYARKHNVSSKAILPTWIPFSSTMAAKELLFFSLQLMTDDWHFERPSNQYFLGDLLNIEASVAQFNHVPLHVFIDSCVATVDPDVNTTENYSFIENHGCLIDTKITGSRSQFMPRVQVDKLQLQLEAFRFLNQSGDLVYITCLLKATTASAPADVKHKACSYTSNGWTEANGGEAQVCDCCDMSCNTRNRRNAPNADLWREARVSLGPILIKEETLIDHEDISKDYQ
ncbi:zona pellucida sperm-binding protein 3 isoform X1 [Astyanax mexicanus]|uniref:zona pellucida sperm-binding protein 3 isoform X1 n=1 Tax=Astyanax mexicanus TaxID=7994 RepID=UPI0020CB6837|nr:zona pellucida sperm-binding protein 3 isoform X1 [Astyanax mexicanus]